MESVVFFSIPNQFRGKRRNIYFQYDNLRTIEILKLNPYSYNSLKDLLLLVKLSPFIENLESDFFSPLP